MRSRRATRKATRRSRKTYNQKGHRKSHRKSYRGAGYNTSQQFFNPELLQRHSSETGVSTAPTNTAIRPILNSTFKGGRSRRAGRRTSGGFSPSVMGSFLQNAQQAIVPLALYSAYHFMPKKSRNIATRRSRRSSRK